MEANDARSILVLASYYHQGVGEFLFQDQEIAMELWKKAAKLGSIRAHFFLGNEYDAVGDLKKAKFHFEAAAMAGEEGTRCNLGCLEGKSILSFADAAGGLPIPRGTPGYVGNIGTQNTRTAQGFLIVVSALAVMSYNASLVLQAYWGIKNNFNEEKPIFRRMVCSTWMGHHICSERKSQSSQHWMSHC